MEEKSNQEVIEIVMSKIESFYFSDGEDSGEALFKAFASKHAVLFEENCDALGTENKLEYTAVYNEFCQMFEQHIERKAVIQSNPLYRHYRRLRRVSGEILQCDEGGAGSKRRKRLLRAGTFVCNRLLELHRHDEAVQTRGSAVKVMISYILNQNKL